MRSIKRHLQLIPRWAEIRGESGSQGEEESEQKKALAEPGQDGTEGRDVSGVSWGLAPLNALAQAAAEAEGRSSAEYGQGAGDNSHIDRVAGGVKGPGAERSRRRRESQICQSFSRGSGAANNGLPRDIGRSYTKLHNLATNDC
jgi:hypothetical protein